MAEWPAQRARRLCDWVEKMLEELDPWMGPRESVKSCLQRSLKLLTDEDGDRIECQQHDELHDDRSSGEFMEVSLWAPRLVENLQRKHGEIAHEIVWRLKDQ